MNIYLKIKAITILIGIIVDKTGWSEQEAILAFYQSKIAQKLDDENILLRQMSPYLLYELWSAEKTLGDYKKSQYATALL